MTSRGRRFVGRGCRANLIASWLFAFFFTSTIHVRGDGSGKMTVVYPAAVTTTQDIERRRFESATSHTTGLKIAGGRARVRVAFGDVNRLAEAPEFANSTIALERGTEGGGRFRALLRATVLGDVKSDAAATVRLSLPGVIVQSNGGVGQGKTAVWSAPIKEYFSVAGMRLEATYQADTNTGTDVQRTARAGPGS